MLTSRSSRAPAITVVLFLFLAFCAGQSYALRPDEILVLANKNAARSVGLAKYYMEKRGIPKNNLIQLWVTDKETCSRDEYERKVVPWMRHFIKEKDPSGRIRCLVSIYGLPLRISPPEMSAAEKKEVEEIRERRKAIGEELKGILKEEEERRKGLTEKYNTLGKRIETITKANYRSAFDSELALVLVDAYSLKGWIRNPLFIGFKNERLEIPREEVLMVSRLDGPSDEIVKRIVNDSIDTEKKGLKGKAYFDARWPKPSEEEAKKAGMGYGFYDRSIHLAAERIRESGLMPVVVNDKPELFQPGECSNAALYCGWYSLARYVDAFKWSCGAVGYHIASSECQTLKNKNSQVWCKRMLEEGVAATLGPVGEPYLQSFPVPEIFFGLLVDGRLTLGDCYMLSLPFLSWQMVLIGDPLYRPFGTTEGH